ncbi:UbiD family decarboxylase [Bradyrhizobium diazoefficiens]
MRSEIAPASFCSFQEIVRLQRDVPRFRELSDFLRFIEGKGQLRRIREPVSVVHEITEIHRRVIGEHGPALLFERPIRADGLPSGMPLLTNLFGTVERTAWGMGITPDRLEELGAMMAELRAPRPPHGVRDAWRKLPLARAALATRPRSRAAAPVQDRAAMGEDIDLTKLPAQICWPGEPAPLITWPHWSSPRRRHRRPPTRRRMSASIACRSSAATAPSSAGSPIAAAPGIISNGRP